MGKDKKAIVSATAMPFLKVVGILMAVLFFIGLILLAVGGGQQNDGVYMTGVWFTWLGFILAFACFEFSCQRVTVYENEVRWKNLFIDFVIPMEEISTYGEGILWSIWVGSSSLNILLSDFPFMTNRKSVIEAIRRLKGQEAADPHEAKDEPPAPKAEPKSEEKAPANDELKEIIYRDCLLSGTVETDEEEELLMNAIWKLEKISPYKDAEDLIEKYRKAIKDYEETKMQSPQD